MEMEIAGKGDFPGSRILFCLPAEAITDLPFIDCPDHSPASAEVGGDSLRTESEGLEDIYSALTVSSLD
jgi:hypothetical protein